MAGDLKGLAFVLMAAGSSKRMGINKLFLEIGHGESKETLLSHSLDLLKEIQSPGGFPWDTYVIYNSDSVKAAAEVFGLKTLFNEKAYLGQSESVKLGASLALKQRFQGVCFMTADQPNMNREVLHRLAEGFNEALLSDGTAPDAVIPVVNGEWLSPVIIGFQCMEALMTLEGDQGAKAYLKGRGRSIIEVPFQEEHDFIDLDTPEDYQRFR